MKDYKLLLAGLTLLLLAIFVALITWLWTHNRKNIDPLPIMANDNDSETVDTDDTTKPTPNRILHVRAAENLQVPLDDIIVSFESRYPHIQVLTSYVPSNTLLTLSNRDSAADQDTDAIFGTDVIIANDRLSAERLSPLQAKLTTAQHQDNQNQASTSVEDVEKNKDGDKKNAATENDNKEARTLTSFNYALRDDQALEGVILTDRAVAISFRNFLLSSTGQGILEKYDYYNINGYENSVDDLFKPTSRAKKASGNNPVDVADALSNSEK